MKSFVNNVPKKKFVKRPSRKYHKAKYISISPENGRELDTVNMMERNRERFQYGLELNR